VSESTYSLLVDAKPAAAEILYVTMMRQMLLRPCGCAPLRELLGHQFPDLGDLRDAAPFAHRRPDNTSAGSGCTSVTRSASS
jgi:hypothetical protein